jgi:sigma-E factor negative regulatory protein RseA
MMSTRSDTQAQWCEDLSALVDGELHDAAVADTCGLWRTDSELRATWHSYQLIGDVLRSEDLASDAARDADFLKSLRSRLALEPVVLAPAPSFAKPDDALVRQAPGRTAARRRWSWMAPTAVAAGFVAVAGALVVTRNTSAPPPNSPAVDLAAAAPRVEPVNVRSGSGPDSSVSVVEPLALVANGQVVRDAGLDRYLAAHKRFAGSTVLGVPSTFVRSATVDVPAR